MGPLLEFVIVSTLVCAQIVVEGDETRGAGVTWCAGKGNAPLGRKRLGASRGPKAGAQRLVLSSA